MNPTIGQHEVVRRHVDHVADGRPESEDCAMCLLQQQEDSADAAVDAAVDALLDAAAPLWHVGDGYGGWVLHRLRDRAMHKGFPVGATDDAGVYAQRRVGKAIRLAIKTRDGGEFCQFCGATGRMEIDHKWPISRGGTSVLENLHFLCTDCNKRKKSTPWHEFLESHGRTL